MYIREITCIRNLYSYISRAVLGIRSRDYGSSTISFMITARDVRMKSQEKV